MRTRIAAVGIVCSLLVARLSLGQETPSTAGAATVPTSRPRTGPARVRIGVISPRNIAAGQGHEDSIRIAEQRLGDTLPLTEAQVRLEWVYETDDNDPNRAVEQARDLVENQHVAAIIGPVSSDCTARVIKEGLKVPIISALSTNPALTDDRDPWFFRATLNDRDRMIRYAQFVTATLKISIGPHVLLCDTGGYGKGLCAALSERLGGAANVKSLTWDDIGARVTEAASAEHLRSGKIFPPQLGEVITGASSIFVLGPSEQAVMIAGGIEEAYHPPGRVPFFFVGSDTDLLLQAPEGAYTIGEPVSDLDQSLVTAAARNEFAKVQDDFSRRSPYPENFVLTAYEVAYYVLPAAIASIVQGHGEIPDLPALRDAIRERLETDTFDTSTPGRKIRFQDGSLADPAPAPVYHIQRRFVREDQVPMRPWLDLGVPDQGRYLEGPIMVKVRGNGVGKSTPVKLTVVRDEDKTVVTTKSLDLSTDETVFTFQPLQRGWFRIAANIPSFPSSAQVQIVWSADYPLCLLGGLAGSVLAVMLAGYKDRGLAGRRIATGVGTGFGLTVLACYRDYLPPSIPIPVPTLGQVPEVNAIFTGFLGGWLGLNLFHLMGGGRGRGGASLGGQT